MSNLNLILSIGAFLAFLLLVPTAAGDQIDAFWTNAYGGNWAAGANWSTAPDYPNNGGAQTYNAIIDLVGAAYTVTLDSAATVVDNFTLSSSSATLTHVSGVFQVLGAAELLAGTYQLSGGTLQGGTWNVAPGTFVVTNNAANCLDAVTFNGNLDLTSTNAKLTIANGLTLNGACNLKGSGATLTFAGTQSLDSATVNFDSSVSGTKYITVPGGSLLTFGQNLTVQGGRGQINGAGTLVNQGRISANASGQTLDLRPTTLMNQGTLEALNGGTLKIGTTETSWTNEGMIEATDATLTLGGNWSNAGTITATNSNVTLGGAFTTAGLGSFNRTGGSVKLTGQLDNTDDTLTLDETTGTWVMGGGTITGGTVQVSAPDKLGFASSSTNHLDGATLNGDLAIATYSSLWLHNGATINGTVNLTGSSSALGVFGGGTIDHTEVRFDAAGGNSPASLRTTPGSLLTLGADLYVHGGGGQVGNDYPTAACDLLNYGHVAADLTGKTIEVLGNNLTNHGLMEALNGATLVIGMWDDGPRPWTNAPDGVLNAATGGTLRLDGDWTNEGLIQVQSGSTLELAGVFARADIGQVQQSGGTIRIGGDVDNAGSTLVMDLAQGPWELAGANITGGTLQVVGGDHTVTVSGSWVTGTETTLDGVTLNGDVHVQSPPSMQTYLRLKPSATINGDITVDDGSTVRVEAPRVLDNMTVHLVGGWPSNAALEAWGAGQLTLGPGMTIDSAEGGVGRISGVSEATILNQGLISSDGSNEQLILEGRFRNEGTIRAVNGGHVLLGEDYYPNVPWSNAPGGTIVADEGHLSCVNSFENQGTITAGNSILTLGSTGFEDTWQNSGLITATNCDVTLQSQWTNLGTIELVASDLVLGGRFTTAGLGTLHRTGGTVLLTGSLDNRNETLTLDAATGSWDLAGRIEGGAVAQSGGATLTVTGSSALDSVRVLDDLHVQNAVGVYNFLQVDGTLYVEGQYGAMHYPNNYTVSDATIVMDQPWAHSSNGLRGSGTFTLDSSTLVRGGNGTIQTLGNRLINRGQVRADVPGTSIKLTADLVLNEGLLRAENDATLELAESADHWINAPGGLISGEGGALELAGLGLNQGVIAARSASVRIWEDFFNEGVLAIDPESSWNLLEDFTQAPWGTVRFELAGTTAGTGYGFLGIAGSAQLGGALAVSLADGYLPQIGDTYQVMSAAQIIRGFDSYLFPVLPAPLYFEVHWDAGSVSLNVAPEPASLALFSLLALRRPRRDR